MRLVRLNPDVIGELDYSLGMPRPFILNLSSSNQLTATSTSNKVSHAAFREWTADLSDAGTLRFTFRPDKSGVMKIESSSRTYTLQPTSTPGTYALLEIIANSFPEGNDYIVSPNAVAPPLRLRTKCDAPLPFPIPTKPEAFIDILLLYTQSAEANSADIRASIVSAFDEMQMALGTRNFSVTVRIADLQRTNFVESADMKNDLQSIRLSTSISSLRNAARADLVSVIGNYPNSGNCGIGYLNEGTQPGADQYGYSLVHYGCLTNRSLAHEIGHNFGMRHDAYVDGAGSYNHGFVLHNLKVRSIMAYNNACSDKGYNCTRINSYSSPQVLLGKNWEPLGDGRSENLEVLCQSAPAVEKFR
ncbi:reprolysin-like metallopeptidase [Bradyrhizobium sp. USDA 4503]